MNFEIDNKYFDFAAAQLQREFVTLFSNPILVMEQG